MIHFLKNNINYIILIIIPIIFWVILISVDNIKSYDPCKGIADIETNATIDPQVIVYLESDGVTVVIIGVYDPGIFTPLPNSSQLDEWRQRGEYYKNIHYEIMQELLDNDEFLYKTSFISSNAFVGSLTCEGYKKLIVDSRIERIQSDRIIMSVN